ncbi:hypothetical protein B0H15DRAFT_838644 [Mycena belliarum]|uniref:FHA domain-containing protein n=1 Tax=Mycena belliarum TaxID=1033014 RepID=A0AAD6U4D6_9AGAR|nr:hypothetical protein B0H15DRAFT_838644 [Mycena belliae]
MPDEDCIQYLGTRPVSRPLPSHPFPNGSQRPVTGVALHIEGPAAECGPVDFIFRKAEEPVVQIGRRPGSDSDKGRRDGKASFSCPVVSRNHAKIAFSESHAYLIDLNSHHGTHVRKRAETVSKQLNPETPTLLVDGDVVTFGKSVGSDKGLVRPIVARIELLYGSQPPLKPLIVPGSAEGQQPSPLRPPSGRYGVYVPEPSSSSDEPESPDSHDSDIEEISDPSPVRPPWNVPNDYGSDSTSPLHALQKQSFPPARQSSPGFTFLRGFSPILQGMRSSSPDFFDRDSYYPDSYSNDNIQESDNGSNYSRSTSPMDLSSSPEPSDAVEKKEAAVAVGEPVIIGAWPRSRSSSPSVFSSSFPPVRISAEERIVAASPVASIPAVADANASVDEVEAEDDNGENNGGHKSVETADLESSLGTIKTEVAKLHAHRRKYKQRFNDNIHVMGERFSDLEERTTEALDLYHLLSDRLEENVDAFHQAQAQLDALQDRIDTTAEKATESEMPPYADEAKSSAKVLEQLVADMTVLRDNARKEMAEELKSIREAKEALRTLTEQLEVQTASLKRKRSDDEVEVEAASAADLGVVAGDLTLRPRKRVRRVANVLAKAATAVTFGAVVTWSALAFS